MISMTFFWATVVTTRRPLLGWKSKDTIIIYKKYVKWLVEKF